MVLVTRAHANWQSCAFDAAKARLYFYRAQVAQAEST